MIKVLDKIITIDDIKNDHIVSELELKIIKNLFSSKETYQYDSFEVINFEVKVRAAIVKTAKDLYKSKIVFKVFRKSKCNLDFWKREENGGFKLKEGVRPSDAVKDIFVNGFKYGTECATAMVIVYYGAMLYIFGEKKFNEMFPKIVLMNWSNIDRNLAIMEFGDVEDNIPGDCRYFKNPEVSPISPEWQGENVIDLGDGRYYGHGIGIRPAKEIIDALNRKRKIGAKKSAYFLDSAKRQNYKFLYQKFV